MPHIHEKIDFTVEVFIVYKDKVLLRLHEKYGIWLSVGGHIELDEDPNQAALREVKEEVGLDIKLFDTREYKQDDSELKELMAPVALNRHHVSETHEHVTFVYFAASDSDSVIPEKETDEWKWCTKEDLETMDLKPQVKFYAIQALETFNT